MLGFKFRAGALQFVIYVALVVALLITAFILLVYTHKRFSLKTHFIIETTQNADKGIRYTLQNKINLNDTTTIALNDEAYKSLKVHRNYWGVFEKITSVANIKTNRFTKIALVGGIQPETERVALYLKDNNKPLVVVGNTRIEGTAYLPLQGIKPGTIAGKSYYGSQLIYGNTKIANHFPELIRDTKIQLNQLELQITELSQDQFVNLERSKSFSNSFLQPVQIVFSNGPINLSGLRLAGHIVVQSKAKITVDGSAKLTDILLMAPEIEISNGVKGQFQAIASKQLIVGQNVQLNYPSALVVNEKRVQQPLAGTNTAQLNDPQLVIGEQSSIKGTVLYLGQPKPNNFKIQFQLQTNTTVFGEVYCNQNFELLGQIKGTVYTDNFIAKQSGSVYQNHIYNGVIIANDLPEEYIGLTFMNSKKGIVKWLY